MEAKIWFLVAFVNGRMEIVSELYYSFEDAKLHYKPGTTICETIYGS